MRADDAESLAARRSDPDVARHQNWTTPYPVERARTLVDEIVAMDGPTSDEWWMLTIADRDAWRSRPRERPRRVELVEVTSANLTAVLALSTHRSQERFVAPVSQSLAEALVPPIGLGRLDAAHLVGARQRIARAVVPRSRLRPDR